MKRRLWVIDPSVGRPETQGVESILGDWPGETRLFLPALRRGDGPGPGCGYDVDAVVVMGSRASVFDDLPWLRELAAWVAPLLGGRHVVPLLGICFGHQLIAHLSGAAVGHLDPDGRKRCGVETSSLAPNRLLGAVPRELRVVVSHREIVRTAPSGYRVIAERDGVLDGLEHETLPVHSFQFHPEAREEFAGYAGIPVDAIDGRVRRDGDALLAAFRRSIGPSAPR